MAEKVGLVMLKHPLFKITLRVPHLRYATSNSVLHPLFRLSRIVRFNFIKWRRRGDSNPWNPFEVHFFSKEALSATQPLLHIAIRRK